MVEIENKLYSEIKEYCKLNGLVIKDFINSIFTKLQGTMANNPFVDFNQIKANYLSSLNDARPLIENTFQSTLNKGYANLFTATAIIACIGFILSLMIRERKNNYK